MNTSNIIGIGASAGGLVPLKAFIQSIPTKSEACFFVLQHRSSTQKSALVQILGSCTELPVQEAEDGSVLKANSIWVCPPGRVPLITGHQIRLRPAESDRSTVRPIDVFLESLASARGSDACAVILSGAGSDGAVGAGAIREAGGLVITSTNSRA